MIPFSIFTLGAAVGHVREMITAIQRAINIISRCREAGVRPSMGSVGGAYDNAMCESFFATL